MRLNNNLFRGILKVILGIGFLLFIFLSLPILVYRQILAKFGPPLSKKLGKILSSKSQVLFSFGPHAPLNVLIWFKLSGKLDSKLLKERFQTKCIFVRNDSGDFAYPEFQQYPTMFGGYAFWKWEESFDMDKHMHHVTLDQEADAHAQFKQMLHTPFPDKSSPWEFTFLDVGETHFISFKFDHSLSDGEAIFKVLMLAADSEVQRLQLPQESRKSCFAFFRRLPYLVGSYLDFIYRAVFRSPSYWNAEISMVRHLPMSRIFDLDEVKQLRSKFNVSVWAMMMELFTGAIRRKLQNEQKPIPNEMRCLTFVTFPNHSNQLTNQIFSFDMTLPVGAETASERLTLLESQAQAERERKSSLVGYIIFLFIGSFPKRWLIPLFPGISAVVSIFPGPTKPISICGNVVEDMAYAADSTFHGLRASIVSYIGTFRYWIGVDGSICSTEKSSTEFADYIDEELQEIRHTNIPSTVSKLTKNV